MDPTHQNGMSGGQMPPGGDGPSPECPSDARLEILLEAGEGSADHRWFVAHLESCDHCPPRLDALWTRMTDSPGTPVPGQLDLDQFNRILGRISARTTASQYDLSFLPLSLRIGCLGKLGPYDLERVIGSGGMGLVFQGRDQRTGERVAVKTLRRPREAGPDLRERFLREGLVAQPISHPGVLPVRDSGTDSGIPYLVTPLLTGRNFDRLIRDKAPLPVAEAVEWIRQAAEALGAAHRLGIVHRDIKPSNLWLRGEGGAARVCVIDFGLALAETRGDLARLTSDGTMVGTPAYIAPEQASGGQAGPPADLFSLGCVLYEMLTGRRVFPGDNPLEVLRAIALFRVVPAERFRPDLPRPLRAILSRCLEPAPADRYPDASALAEDLRRLQAGLKSLYSPPGWPEKLRRWAVRHPGLAATFGLVALGLTTSTAVSVYQANQAGAARARAEAEVEISRATAERNRHLLYFAGVRSALDSYNAGRAGEALATLTRMDEDPQFQALIGFEWHHLERLCRQTAQEMTVGAAGGFPVVHEIAELEPGIVTAYNKDSFIRADWAKGAITHFPVEHDRKAPGAITMSPDGRRGAWLEPGGEIRSIDLQTGVITGCCKGLASKGESVSHLALGPARADRLYLCLGESGGGKTRLVAWDLAKGEVSHSHDLATRPDFQLKSSPDGTALLTVLQGGSLALWRPGSGGGLTVSRPIPLESPLVFWRADGKNCYVMGREKFQTRVYHWDFSGAPVPVEFGGAQPDLMVPALSGDFFALDSKGMRHRLEGGLATRAPGQVAPGVYTRGLIGSDGRFPLLAACRRNTVARLALSPPSPAERHTLAPREKSLAVDLVWLDESHLVARQTPDKEGFSRLTLLRHEVAAENGAFRLIPLRETRLKGRCQIVHGSPPGRLLLAREGECLWIGVAGEEPAGIHLKKLPFRLLALGDGYAGLTRDGTLFRLDGSMREQWSLGVSGSEEGSGELLCFCAAPDSSSLAVLWRRSGKSTLSWIRAKDGGLISTDTREEWEDVMDMAMVTPESLAITRATGEISLHSLREGRATATMKNLDRVPIYLSHSTAAGRMATIDAGGQVDLWDVRHWLHVPVVSNPQENRSNIPLGLSFSPGGDKLAFFGEDGTISVLSGPGPRMP